MDTSKVSLVLSLTFIISLAASTSHATSKSIYTFIPFATGNTVLCRWIFEYLNILICKYYGGNIYLRFCTNYEAKAS